MKLINQNRRYMLMEEAGGDGGPGGNGAPSLITPAGQASTPPSGGGDGNPGDGGEGKGNPPAPKTPAAPAATDWRSALPKELQDDATVKKFPSVEALAGAYINAQKLIGVDKIPVPGKNTTADEWKNIYSKLGLPESVEKYDVKFKEGVTIDDNFSKAFRENAHKAGILPTQAQGLADWFSDITKESENKFMQERKQNFDTGVAELRKEWGNAFDLNIARANKLILDTGAVEHFNKMGYGSDPLLMKYLATAAEKIYKDAKIVDGGKGSGANARTPNEIKAAIGKLQTDVAYNSKDHPGHAAAVQEMSNLHAELYPVDKK